MKKCFLFTCMLLFAMFVKAQHVTLTPEQIKGYTPEWKGERFPDGRPKVEDKWLERLKKVRLEEGWGILRNKGYQNQFEGDWMVLEPDSAMTGRVVTAQYLPLRPDVDKIIKDIGKTEPPAASFSPCFSRTDRSQYRRRARSRQDKEAAKERCPCVSFSSRSAQ